MTARVRKKPSERDYPKQRTHWSEEEILFLKEYHGKKPYKWIAKQLKRTASSVSTYAYRLELPLSYHDKIEQGKPAVWAKKLGISEKIIYRHIETKKIKTTKYDSVSTKFFYIDDMTIIEWLREGYAIICTVNRETPRVIADIIHEEKTKWISKKELVEIDSWLDPHVLMHKQPKRKGIQVGKYDYFYLKSEVYEHIHRQGLNIPVSIKDPYIRAIRLAWESVYLPAREIHQYYIPKRYKDHPKQIAPRTYLRKEIVHWLRGKRTLAKHVRHFVQDEITYQELHADIEWRKQNNLPIF